MKLHIPFVTILLAGAGALILCTSCSESPDRDQGFTLTRRDEGRKRVEEPPPGRGEEKIVSDSLTPELFVEITIRHRKETMRWLEESQAFPAREQESYLERMNREHCFFVLQSTTIVITMYTRTLSS